MAIIINITTTICQGMLIAMFKASNSSQLYAKAKLNLAQMLANEEIEPMQHQANGMYTKLRIFNLKCPEYRRR